MGTPEDRAGRFFAFIFTETISSVVCVAKYSAASRLERRPRAHLHKERKKERKKERRKRNKIENE
jgi:hypothetical protein